MNLVKKSKSLQKEANKIIALLDLNSLCSRGESPQVIGSVKYGLLVEDKLDIDIAITVKDEAKSFVHKMKKLAIFMLNNPQFRKLKVTNLYHNYKKGHKKSGKELKGFVLDLQYVSSMDLTKAKSWSIEIWITQQVPEESFIELEDLPIKNKEGLLSIKSQIYKNYEDFPMRSYLIYKSYLEGETKIKKIIPKGIRKK